jgi:hypothetical protein
MHLLFDFQRKSSSSINVFFCKPGVIQGHKVTPAKNINQQQRQR